jgi:S1-C subfamily serine protease
LDGYKYVYIAPLKYEDGTIDKFGLMVQVANRFEKMGLQVIKRDVVTGIKFYDIECMSLLCIINHNGGLYGKNEFAMSLTNCNDVKIYSIQTKANAPTWYGETTIDKDLRKCIDRAFDPLQKKPGYSYDRSLTPIRNLPLVEQTHLSEDSLRIYYEHHNLDPIEGIYKSVPGENISYYKIGIIRDNDRFKAIVIESDNSYWKPGEVKAYIERTATREVFSTKWYLATKTQNETFLTMENGGFYVINKNQHTGESIKNGFIKMFPYATNSPNGGQGTAASGSGFFVSKSGIIATNAHLIADAKKINVKVSNDQGISNYSAKIVLNDAQNDVALLQIDDQKFNGTPDLPYTILSSADVGEKVFTIGYPLNDIMGTNFKVTDGIISSKSGIGDDVRYFQISVPLQPGNSGGPLFDKDGDVIGITTARLNSAAVGTQVENVNYAVKAGYLLNLLNMLPNHEKLPSSSLTANKEFKDQIQVLKNFVCLIEVN